MPLTIDYNAHDATLATVLRVQPWTVYSTVSGLRIGLGPKYAQGYINYILVMCFVRTYTAPIAASTVASWRPRVVRKKLLCNAASSAAFAVMGVIGGSALKQRGTGITTSFFVL